MENFQDSSVIEQEKRKTAEAKEKILSGAFAFAQEVIQQYPQLSESGKLNYYFSGSLATILLLQANELELLDESKVPEIVIIDKKEISTEAKSALSFFVRKIGDLDFVRLKEWEQSGNMMKKGGGGPKLADLSETAKQSLEINENQSAVMCDPLSTYTPHRVARLNLENQDIYITEPKMILAYKIVHLAQSFENGNKTDKFISDFNALLKSMEMIYSHEELLASAHEAVFSYQKNDPNNTYIPYNNEKFTGDLKAFYDELIALDSDASYLADLEYGQERSIGILKILHTYESAEAKQLIINFFNKQKARIDLWSINGSSKKNREIMADFLLVRPNLLDGLKKYIDKEISREVLVEALQSHPWVFLQYGDQVENKDSFDMKVRSSTLMEILAHLNEVNLADELDKLDYFLSSGLDEYELSRLFTEDNLKNREIRNLIFLGLENACQKLEKETLKRLLYNLRQVIYNTSLVNNPPEVKNMDIKDAISSVFADFSIEF